MLFVAVGAWIAGVAVSFANGNRVLPLIILLLGMGLFATIFFGVKSHFALAGIAFLAAIIWVANKADDLR